MKSKGIIRVKKSKKNRNAMGTVLNLVLGLSIVLMILSAIAAITLKNQDAFLFGFKPYIIASESMEPTYQKYAFVLIRNSGYDDVKEGEVIAFKADMINGQAAFHRVLTITPDGLVTKGDANRVADDQLVTQNNFLGREVWHTNFTATAFFMLQTPGGILLVLILPLLAVILILAIKIMKMQKKASRR